MEEVVFEMKEKKLNTISNLFDGKEIRSIWDSDKEEYYLDFLGPYLYFCYQKS